MESVFKKIKEDVRKELACSAHDIEHVERVYNTALKIAGKEKNVNLKILKAAALLHDIARAREDDDKTGKICHARESAKMAKSILKRAGFDKKEISKVQHCILAHRYKNNIHPKTIEAKILFDADKLDSLGAIVIMRAGMWMGRNKCRIMPAMPLEKYIKKNLMNGKMNGRIKDSSMHNIFYEHEIKDKKLPGIIHTKSGRAMARNRLKFTDMFLKRLKMEISGKL